MTNSPSTNEASVAKEKLRVLLFEYSLTQAAKELNISLMTVWRWDRDPELAALGWPPPVYIRKRKYRGRRLLEKFKSAALRRAIRARGK
jgi:hypothetical protein